MTERDKQLYAQGHRVGELGKMASHFLTYNSESYRDGVAAGKELREKKHETESTIRTIRG